MTIEEEAEAEKSLRAAGSQPTVIEFYLKLLAHGMSHERAREQVSECIVRVHQ